MSRAATYFLKDIAALLIIKISGMCGVAAARTNFASKFESSLKWLGLGLCLMLLPGASAWAGTLVGERGGPVTRPVQLPGVSAEPVQTIEFPFTLRAGLIWVQVDGPQGGKPLNFILDSGAEASVINLQTARHLRLKQGQPVNVSSIDASAVGYWPEKFSARMGGVAEKPDCWGPV